jgi:endo-1,4-beta-xylanase
MSLSAKNHILVQFLKRIVVPSRMIPLLVLLCCAGLSAQVVATYSFEDGTADGWTSFNGASTPVATTAAAYVRVV